MSDIDEVKTRVDIVEVIGERVTLKKTGRNLKGLCPFHAEKSPSFIVSPDRQTFHCFGCGKGGSVFDFVMFYEHLDFAESLEVLAHRANFTLTRRVPQTDENKIKERIYEVNHLASEYYHFLLTKHNVGKNAREYVKTRGISDKSLTTFGIGYSPNTWDGLTTYLKKKGYDEKLLETAGLVIRGGRGVYDRFRGRLMFTLKDHRGQVVGFSGRLLDNPSSPKATEGQEQPKYINTSETPVYIKSRVLFGLDVTKDAIQKLQEAVVMEGELDVISSFQAGVSNVVAIKGSAVTEEHARLLRRFAERLIFALDSDLAGDAAARRGIEIADKSGFDMRVVTMPSGKDPDDAVREDEAAFKKAIKHAIPVYDYFINSACARFDPTVSFGKKKITEELVPIIAKIENPVVAGHYVRVVAKKLDVPEEMVQESVRRVLKTGRVLPAEEKPDLPGQETLSRRERIELYLLALLVQGDPIVQLPLLTDVISIDEFIFPAVQKILTVLHHWCLTHTQYDPKVFVLEVSQELLPVFDEAFLWDLSEILMETNKLDREWKKMLIELRRLHVREKMKQLVSTMQDENASLSKIQILEDTLKALTIERAALEKER